MQRSYRIQYDCRMSGAAQPQIDLFKMVCGIFYVLKIVNECNEKCHLSHV